MEHRRTLDIVITVAVCIAIYGGALALLGEDDAGSLHASSTATIALIPTIAAAYVLTIDLILPIGRPKVSYLADAIRVVLARCQDRREWYLRIGAGCLAIVIVQAICEIATRR